ncbi:hypothetical protein AYK26_04960 [Euryarchaeota archaeon SM23-78]|nr:MAG: hypothetical protein AYK26_04960 [Euryarchaeota archaeon SM23-78]MBW3000919.1 hypothetical protein [Candidatus Woesearchaeota archaeon]
MDLEFVKKLDTLDLIKFDTLDLSMLVGKTIKNMQINFFNPCISPGPQILFQYTDNTSLIIGGSGVAPPHHELEDALDKLVIKDVKKYILSQIPQEDRGELSLLYYNGKEYYWKVLQEGDEPPYPQTFPKC